MVSVDGMLFAIGGGDGTNSLQSVEYYCPVKDEWTLTCPLSIERLGLSAISIPYAYHEYFGYSFTYMGNH